MFTCKIPSPAEITAFQAAATQFVMDGFAAAGSPALLVGPGQLPDLRITNVSPCNSYKIVVVGTDPSAPADVFLWVYVGSYDGSGGYGEWYTKINGSWVSTETTEDYDGSNGQPSWSV